jgi:uncharacterized protein (DUF2235 family)
MFDIDRFGRSLKIEISAVDISLLSPENVSMARKIVVLSDGTGNSSAALWRTNVWRTFDALDLSGSDQVAFYDDGVGTSSFKPLAILGGAFGYGLKRNVIDIYKFVCRNYQTDADEIFGFGFSRGAFTIRVVMGLILDQGLVQADNEIDLDRLPPQHTKITTVANITLSGGRSSTEIMKYRLQQLLPIISRSMASAFSDFGTLLRRMGCPSMK